MGRHKCVLPGPPGAFFFLRCRAGSFECGVFAFVSLGPECSRGGCHRGGVQLMLEFAHRFRGADIITPRLDLSQSFVPKRGPDSGETADLEVARGARGAPTFGGLLLAFLATWPTKNASRRMI